MKFTFKIKESNDVIDWYPLFWLSNLFKKVKEDCIYSHSYAMWSPSYSAYRKELDRKQLLIDIIKSSRNNGIQAFSLEQLLVKNCVLNYGQSTVVVFYNYHSEDLPALLNSFPELRRLSFSLHSAVATFIPCTSVKGAIDVSRRVERFADVIVIDKGVPVHFSRGDIQ